MQQVSQFSCNLEKKALFDQKLYEGDYFEKNLIK